MRVCHASRSPGREPLTRVDFPFQRPLGPDATQEDAFDAIRAPLEAALNSSTSAVVFAYGQTGSGKTYTMLGGGTFRTRGLMQRTLGLVFARVDAAAAAAAAGAASMGAALPPRPTVSLSMAEVLGEGVFDVLGHLPPGAAGVAASPDPMGVGARLAALAGGGSGGRQLSGRVELREGEDGSLLTRGLSTWAVGTEAAGLGLLLAGHLARATGATPLNDVSSRSHAVLTLRVAGLGAGGSGCSSLHLVDLAGSERVHKNSGGGGSGSGGGSGGQYY